MDESPSTTAAPFSAPNVKFAATPRKRVLWKLSIAATVLVGTLYIWWGGSAVYEGRNLAIAAAREFHLKMNEGDLQELCREADPDFTGSGSQDEPLKVLEAVHTKLGNVGASYLENIRVNATTNGTFIVTQHKTTFDRGSAVETFTWKKSSGILKLYGYNIQSNALVLK
jgi:hypothetical protein